MQCFCNSWRVRNLLVMVLRVNKCLKYRELMPTPDCSGPAPAFVPSDGEYSTPHVSSTMPEKTPFSCPEFSCQKELTSDSLRLKYIKFHHHEHLKVARQVNLTVRSAPRRLESSQRREWKANHDSVDDFHAFPYLEQIEHISDSESQPPLPPLPRTETSRGAIAPLSDYIAAPLELNSEGFHKMNQSNNPYYPFVTHEEYKYTQCGIEKKGMKTYYDNVLTGENTALHFQSFKNRDGVQKLVASMPDDLALREWELHTFGDMKWNNNHQHPIKY